MRRMKRQFLWFVLGALGLSSTLLNGQTGSAQPQGWAVRASLASNRPLYNTAKQKLLDGKQIFSYAITRKDADLYCKVAAHYDYIWFEMQHSTMSYADVEAMIAACPRVGVPMI